MRKGKHIYIVKAGGVGGVITNPFGFTEDLKGVKQLQNLGVLADLVPIRFKSAYQTYHQTLWWVKSGHDWVTLL